MRKIRFEEMVPDELIAIRKESGRVFLPIGSLEWHGPHMGMGMDTVNAYGVAEQIAEKIGGAVLPPLYIGTETERTPETLRRVGFHGDEHIVGMDFPNNSLKSFYWPPDLFQSITEQQIRMLCEMGFRDIVILNGHGADKQIDILSTLSRKLSKEYHVKIRAFLVLFEDCGVGIGHAGLAETSIMQYFRPTGVELEKLPPKPEKLLNVQYAIVDNETFTHGPNEDFSVRYDPRDATEDIGKQLVEFAVKKCIQLITES